MNLGKVVAIYLHSVFSEGEHFSFSEEDTGFASVGFESPVFNSSCRLLMHWNNKEVW